MNFSIPHFAQINNKLNNSLIKQSAGVGNVMDIKDEKGFNSYLITRIFFIDRFFRSKSSQKPGRYATGNDNGSVQN